MEKRETATVYFYQYWDEDSARLVTSKWEATLECIRSGLGTPIIATGRQVPARDLDPFGRLIEPESQPPPPPTRGQGPDAR